MDSLDRVQRNYAKTAWTPADPLQGLSPPLRLAILTATPTFREHWRLRFWKTQAQKREALRVIMAERRLKLDIQNDPRLEATPLPMAPTPYTGPTTIGPYYQARLERFYAERREQDRQDLLTLPEAQADHAERLAIKERWLELELEKTRILREQDELRAGKRPAPLQPSREPRPEKPTLDDAPAMQRRHRHRP